MLYSAEKRETRKSKCTRNNHPSQNLKCCFCSSASRQFHPFFFLGTDTKKSHTDIHTSKSLACSSFVFASHPLRYAATVPFVFFSLYFSGLTYSAFFCCFYCCIYLLDGIEEKFRVCLSSQKKRQTIILNAEKIGQTV
jgi:hypothetical protein